MEDAIHEHFEQLTPIDWDVKEDIPAVDTEQQQKKPNSSNESEEFQAVCDIGEDTLVVNNCLLLP